MAGRVDVSASLREFGESLRRGADLKRCRDILALLWRWQRDPDLDAGSQRQAKDLIRQYGKLYNRSAASEKR